MSQLKKREREFATNFINCCWTNFARLYPDLVNLSQRSLYLLWERQYYTADNDKLRVLLPQIQVASPKHTDLDRFRNTACHELLSLKLLKKEVKRYSCVELFESLGEGAICYLFAVIDEAILVRLSTPLHMLERVDSEKARVDHGTEATGPSAITNLSAQESTQVRDSTEPMHAVRNVEQDVNHETHPGDEHVKHGKDSHRGRKSRTGTSARTASDFARFQSESLPSP